MRWLRKLFGIDYPDPVEGQIWRCARNNEFMRVSSVRMHTSGLIFVNTEDWIDADDAFFMLRNSWGIASWYAVGLDRWRIRLRQERRVFMGMDYDPRSFTNPQFPPFPMPLSALPTESPSNEGAA